MHGKFSKYKSRRRRKKHSKSHMCPVICEGFPSVAVCCPSLATCEGTDDTRGGCLSATSSVLLPKKAALRFKLVRPGKKKSRMRHLVFDNTKTKLAGPKECYL